MDTDSSTGPLGESSNWLKKPLIMPSPCLPNTLIRGNLLLALIIFLLETSPIPIPNNLDWDGLLDGKPNF